MVVKLAVVCGHAWDDGMRAQVLTAVLLGGVLSLSSAACVRRYIAASKTAEARNALGAIGESAVLAYERVEMPSGHLWPDAAPPKAYELCASSSKSVPASPSSIRGTKYQSTAAEWAVDGPDGGFACLGFRMDQPQYYLYSYTRSGKGSAVGDGFSAKANGDLNGDGVLSTFELKGQVGPDYVLKVAPTLLEINPME
jgi:type IV pilus assembly protein PilA